MEIRAKEPVTKHTKIAGMLILSAGFHVLVLYLLNHSLVIPSKPTEADRTQIRATLYFPPPAVIEPAPPPQPEVIQQQPPETDQRVFEQAQQQAKDEQQQIEDETHQADEHLVVTPVEQQVSDNQQGSAVAPPTPAQIRSMTQAHIGQLNHSALEETSLNAARAYQQQRGQPVYPKLPDETFMTEDEKLRQQVNTRADCSGTARKALVSALSILGGSVQCSEGPDLAPFINKRILGDSEQQNTER